MRKTLSIISTIALIAASPVFAQASKQENVGTGTGALVGAAAGGPVGLVLGAAIGARIGNNMHTKNATIDSLNASLDASNESIRQLSRDVDSLGAELDRLQQIDRPALVNLLQAGIAMDLLFRTDESALADATGDRLADLARSVAAMPDINVQLDGYADERGDSDYNLELSRQRVEFVRDQLVAAGIDGSRIRIAAHGEVPAQDATPDSYALERRVSLKIFIGQLPAFAANPN